MDVCTEEAWDAVLDANLKSVFLYAKRALAPLRANGGGAIVALSSALGLVGGDADFATHAYAASKAGVIGLIRAMAVTYANRDRMRSGSERRGSDGAGAQQRAAFPRPFEVERIRVGVRGGGAVQGDLRMADGWIETEEQESAKRKKSPDMKAKPVLSVLRLRCFAPTLRMTGSEGLSTNGHAGNSTPSVRPEPFDKLRTGSAKRSRRAQN